VAAPGPNSLLARAFRLLARQDHSRLQLRRKLLRNGPYEEVDQVILLLEEKGLLNDEIFALQRASHRRQQRLWGDGRIARDLKSLGIDARIIRKVLAQVESEKSQQDSLQEAIQKWVRQSGRPEALPQLKKLYDHCFRLGYEPGLIREHLESYF
jgi:regulatory protein